MLTPGLPPVESRQLLGVWGILHVLGLNAAHSGRTVPGRGCRRDAGWRSTTLWWLVVASADWPPRSRVLILGQESLLRSREQWGEPALTEGASPRRLWSGQPTSII